MRQPPTNTSMLQVSNLSKDYGSVEVLRDVSFSFTEGVSVAITGPSGSGKSTLLHIIGTLEKPTTDRLRLTTRIRLSSPNLNWHNIEIP